MTEQEHRDLDIVSSIGYFIQWLSFPVFTLSFINLVRTRSSWHSFITAVFILTTGSAVHGFRGSLQFLWEREAERCSKDRSS